MKISKGTNMVNKKQGKMNASFKCFAALAHACLVAVVFLPFPASAAEEELTIVSFNIRIGCGHDGPFRVEKGTLGCLPQCAAVVKSFAPDFVGLQEVDSRSERVDGVDQTAVMARACGLEGAWVEKIPQYGISLLSRKVPLKVEKVLMPGSAHTRALQVAEFSDCFVANTHFPLTAEKRTNAAETVCRFLSPKALQKPVFLMGDFNARPDSASIRKLKEDFVVLSDESKFTWPAKAPKRTIDYIFVDKAHADRFKVIERKVEAHPEATDHCLIMVRLAKIVP